MLDSDKDLSTYGSDVTLTIDEIPDQNLTIVDSFLDWLYTRAYALIVKTKKSPVILKNLAKIIVLIDKVKGRSLFAKERYESLLSFQRRNLGKESLFDEESIEIWSEVDHMKENSNGNISKSTYSVVWV